MQGLKYIPNKFLCIVCTRDLITFLNNGINNTEVMRSELLQPNKKSAY